MQTASTPVEPLQPHNGFIWNCGRRATRSRIGRSFNPTTGSSGTTNARVRRERTNCFNPTTGSSGTIAVRRVRSSTAWLQSHNGFIWNRPATAAVTWITTGFNPTTGSSGTVSSRRCSTRRPCFNPTTGSSGTLPRPALLRSQAGFNPTTGSSGTVRRTSDTRPDLVASTPQRVHLERRVRNRPTRLRRFNPTTGSSGTVVDGGSGPKSSQLQPHNGFIWNSRARSSVAQALMLQPHNGFIWNRPRGPPG